jgi:hypothetical protein
VLLQTNLLLRMSHTLCHAGVPILWLLVETKPNDVKGASSFASDDEETATETTSGGGGLGIQGRERSSAGSFGDGGGSGCGVVGGDANVVVKGGGVRGLRSAATKVKSPPLPPSREVEEELEEEDEEVEEEEVTREPASMLAYNLHDKVQSCYGRMVAYRLEATSTVPPSKTAHKAVDQRNAAIDFLRNRKGRVLGTPGCQIGYVDNNGCHQSNRVLMTAK